MDTLEDEREIVGPQLNEIAEQEDELGSMSEEEEETVSDKVSDEVVEDEFKTICGFN